MFLEEPPHDERVSARYDADRDGDGYVMNLTRLWCWSPELLDAYQHARDRALRDAGLSEPETALLVVTTARSRGDSYCSLAWGARLARALGDDIAATVLRGGTDGLDDRASALVRWAGMVATDPNTGTQHAVDELRWAGFADRQILALTVFAALRMAFSTVNDALGALPDDELSRAVPVAVRDAVDYGRPAAGA